MFSLYLIRPWYKSCSSLTALLSQPLQTLLSKGWVSVRPSAWQSMPITSAKAFLGRARSLPPTGLRFWTLLSQPSLRITWPCHQSWGLWSTFARSSSYILSRRSCELTWSLVEMPHIQQFLEWFRDDDLVICIQGCHVRNFWERASRTVINSKELRQELWWAPMFTLDSSLRLQLTSILLLAFSCVLCWSHIDHFSTPILQRAKLQNIV